MERRFKRIFVSFHIIVSYGKDFDMALMDALPEATQVMGSDKNLLGGCVEYLLYNKAFDVIGDAKSVPLLKFKMEPKPEYKGSIIV
jgi:hypothetical protein